MVYFNECQNTIFDNISTVNMIHNLFLSFCFHLTQPTGHNGCHSPP